MARYFFFGTLMDLEVLGIVLNRPVRTDELVPAKLAGFVRMKVSDGPYPMLVEDARGVVDGKVFDAVSEEDDARILFFEDYDYEMLACRPILDSGERIDALFCGADTSLLQSSNEEWSLASWPPAHRSGFLAVSRIYMGCFGKMGVQAAEEIWLDACKTHLIL